MALEGGWWRYLGRKTTTLILRFAEILLTDFCFSFGISVDAFVCVLVRVMKKCNVTAEIRSHRDNEGWREELFGIYVGLLGRFIPK